MKAIEVENKEQFLKDNYPFGNAPNMDEKKLCLHCDEEIKVGDFKTLQDDTGFVFICCPNAPECDGTAIDWMPLD